MISTPLKKIDDFWSWFGKSADQLSLGKKSSIRQLGVKVESLGDYGWEIGPGFHGDGESKSFVLSPKGNPELLEQTKAIIAKAPYIDNWEFWPAKPPKKWNRKFYFTSRNGDKVAVDASTWKYTLLRYDDGLLEIIFYAPNLFELSEALREKSVWLVADSELGEEFVIKNIAAVTPIESFTAEFSRYADSNRHISDLGDHATSLVVGGK